MKCTRCGAEIINGKLYCSKCGAEVQMVDTYNVMEDELFVELSHPSGEETDRQVPETTEKRTKALLLSTVLALAGFALFLLSGLGIRAMQAEPDAADDTMVMMQALSENRRDAAILQAQEASAASAQTEPLFWLAWLYEQNDETDQQILTLERILAADENNIYACRNLIHIYVEKGDFEALHELYERYESSSLAGLFSDYLLDAPQIMSEDKAYFAGDTLTIQAQTGQNIYYTMDGTSPITNGTLYYAPIVLSAGDYVLQAVACNEEGYYSTVSTCRLSVEEPYQLGMPQVTPSSGEYLSPQTIHISVPVGCNAYYSWNGTPSTSSRKYDGSIAMPEGNNVLSVILVDEYGNTSSVQRMNYIYMP